ncbi:ABC transporter ATP-binding protein [Leucobacter weissii]|uniref:ABC-type quaternary amine transporter n=1 Tax=Leucobacter weissii TaxID=1983706 RepID=A0A939MJ66_9MICO|nr:ABC transporter ATP-binding protein [Leucobacter weissii]MBO1900975.1 ABC transporter ATP-binding protein [Leucobacter weissii]
MSDVQRADARASSASEAPHALEVRGISKYYGDQAAVDDVSFALEPGTFLTMLGPSGSGKTTTLGMIAGFTLQDRGTIEVAGRDISEIPPHKRGIGVVFQNYALFPHLTVEQNVAFPLEMQGMRRRDSLRKAREALEMVELANRARHLPKQLSGGQQQRVALARAVVFEPPLLLMDEPLGALDKRLRTQMQIEIMRISRNLGSTVVYVTHDQEEALVMSDLIAVYNNGAIEQLGTSRDLYETPRTRFVADFIGESVLLPCAVGSDGSLIGTGWHGGLPERAELRDGRGVLVLRPEDLSIESVPPGERDRPRPDSIAGTVADVIYIGSALLYLVRTDDGRELEVRAPRTEAALRVSGGDHVRVGWRPGQAVVVPDDGPGARGADTGLATQQLLAAGR